MDHTVITYVGYIMVAIPLTIWVAKTLHKNGRIFLLKSMKGDEDLADSGHAATGSKERSGNCSSRYSLMTADSAMTLPSSHIRDGTFPRGVIFRNSAEPRPSGGANSSIGTLLAYRAIRTRTAKGDVTA